MARNLLEFLDSRDRIRRADTHRQKLAKLWDDFLEDEPYAPFVKVDDDGTGRVWITPQRDIPVIFSLLLGEMLYQLRAALDACIYGAAILDTGKDPPPDPQNLEFPICSTRRNFKNSARKIAPLAHNRRAIIESVQPYNTTSLRPGDRIVNDHLWLLNDLARRDRHRKLHVVYGWASESSPRFRIPEGTRITSLNVTASGPLKDEHEVATFRVEGWEPHMKIKANPDLGIHIALNEPIPWHGGPYELGTLTGNTVDAVSSVVDRIERTF